MVSRSPESTDSQWQSTNAVTGPSALSTASNRSGGVPTSPRSRGPRRSGLPRPVRRRRSGRCRPAGGPKASGRRTGRSSWWPHPSPPSRGRWRRRRRSRRSCRRRSPQLPAGRVPLLDPAPNPRLAEHAGTAPVRTPRSKSPFPQPTNGTRDRSRHRPRGTPAATLRSAAGVERAPNRRRHCRPSLRRVRRSPERPTSTSRPVSRAICRLAEADRPHRGQPLFESRVSGQQPVEDTHRPGCPGRRRTAVALHQSATAS